MVTTHYIDLKTLLNDLQHGPFVSIYLNTLPLRNEAEKSQITYKNLLKEAKEQFTTLFPETNWSAFEAQLTPLLSDATFWRDQLSVSLGIIVNQNEMMVTRLNAAVTQRVSVSRFPDLMPIINNSQRQFDYTLLCLNQDSFRLFKYQGQRFNEIILPEDAPTTLKRALGDEIKGGDLNFRTNGDGAGSVSYHGHNAKDEETEIDHRNYYQAIDDYLIDHVDSKRLILFGLSENQALFRQLSKNSALAQHLRITASPANLSKEQIQKQTEPLHQQWAAAIVAITLDRYQNAIPQRKTLTTSQDLVLAAKAGQIDTLLLAQDGFAAGIMTADGLDQSTSIGQRHNLLFDLSDYTLNFGGKVVIIPSEQMPEGQTACAISRYR
ncbi:hypothetical protein BSQ39_05925 [Loigolactobacillus backii]|uniref:baeRF6 domain-containing protein n=1 Tax=Loigolactobacillus backii TaxID=375175 RepID=UPI000C1CA0A5|nr:hypothetical protein [Loigolactobacillus backii]PIO83146.1 hypothetical protein BSQ39_05925 [Loigolactobacillus backii]